MSYQVLVIPEDATNDQYLLRPLVKKLLNALGKPQAKVVLLTNPRAQGYAHIKTQLPLIWQRYQHFDLLLFLPDRDCRAGGPAEAQALEAKAHATGLRQFWVCAAEEEVEVWLLAGHVKKLPQPWSTIRADCDVKERFCVPFLARYGDQSAGGGRERLMEETVQNWDGLLERCPELKTLQTRLTELT